MLNVLGVASGLAFIASAIVGPSGVTTNYTLFDGTVGMRMIEGFDGITSPAMLAGDEFEGFVITGRRINLLDPLLHGVDGFGQGSFNSAPNVISACFETNGADHGDDDFCIRLDTPASAAGLWVCNLGGGNPDLPGNQVTTVTFLDSGDKVISAIGVNRFSENVVDVDGLYNNRIFVGLMGKADIRSIHVSNSQNDGDCIALDDVQFKSAESCSVADLAAPFGLLDLADINAFAAGFLAMDPIADLNADGLFDLTDINLFVTSFVAGCP